MTLPWKILLICSVILNGYFLVAKDFRSVKTSVVSLTPTTSPLAKQSPEFKTDWDKAKEEVDQGLASLGCQHDSTLYGMGQCISKQMKYLEDQIDQAESKFKETARATRGTIQINSTYKPTAKELMDIQVKDIIAAHKNLRAYADARCDLVWFNLLGGAEAGVHEGYCKINLYEDYLVELKSHATYLHPEWYLYPESIQIFMRNPTPDTWQQVIDDADAGKLGPKDSAYVQLVIYDDARLHRDFPNSMARPSGFDMNEYFLKNTAELNTSLAFIRKGADNNFWKLLEVMAVGFKDYRENSLVVTSSEIAARLDPVRFNDLAIRVSQASPSAADPDRDLVFRITREKWIPKNEIEKFMECEEPFEPTKRMHTLMNKGIIPSKPITTLDGSPNFVAKRGTTFYGIPVLLVSAFDWKDKNTEPLYQEAIGTLSVPFTQIYLEGSEENVKGRIPQAEQEIFGIVQDTGKWSEKPPASWPTNKVMTMVICRENDAKGLSEDGF